VSHCVTSHIGSPFPIGGVSRTRHVFVDFKEFDPALVRVILLMLRDARLAGRVFKRDLNQKVDFSKFEDSRYHLIFHNREIPFVTCGSMYLEYSYHYFIHFHVVDSEINGDSLPRL